MKKLLFLILTIGGANYLQAQMPTVADIYDFQVGDEFHSRYPLAPPNATRVTITGKYFSTGGDTLFYIRAFDNYSSVVNMSPSPHLVYTAQTGTDTIYYTRLSDPVNLLHQMPNDSCDSHSDNLYFSSAHCNAHVYEYQSCLDCCFEGHLYNEILGEGLGQLYYDYEDYGNMYHTRYEQFYYHKGVTTCGTPDTTSHLASLAETSAREGARVYPNPASGQLKLSNIYRKTDVRLYDAFGRLVLQAIADMDCTLDVSSLSSGVYMLLSAEGSVVHSAKVVIERN